MRRLLNCSVFVAAVILAGGCSTHQAPKVHPGNWYSGDVLRLVGTWGEPGTIMKLPNNRTLYIFGEGEDKTTVTPVRSIPGQELVMVSEEGRPAKFEQMRNQRIATYKKDSQKRILWVEADSTGHILLAGCSGCTDKENRFLAMQGLGEKDQNYLSTDYADLTD